MGIPFLEGIFKSDDKSNDAAKLDPEFPTFLSVFTFSVALLLRILVGYQPHSGQDNFHGSKVAYGGDYEAQRHWLEITWHLPVGDWYYYDLEYWGLDYPPLTAYVSYVCGALSHFLVGPETVALDTSRGYENDPTHKAFMRATVYVLDALIYFPAVYYCFKALWRQRKAGNVLESFDYDFMRSVLIALLQPAIILIDHGHFQYNTVALGLSLWGLYFMSQTNFATGCIAGSICFCLALNFKQMTLYYAPVIFAYLLGRCFRQEQQEKGSSNGGAASQSIVRLVALGATVIITFGILWWPFLINGPTSDEAFAGNTTDLIIQRGKHVLHRIFPFQRGLFEGKVANMWCALDTKPVNIRDRIPVDLQPMAALIGTSILMLPSCIKLFLVGKQPNQNLLQNQTHLQHSLDLNALLWGTTSSALAFFLASFQVHEKSLLLALAPASLLCWDEVIFSDWFALVAPWTMWPLWVMDRLQTAYTCTVLFFNLSCLQLRRDRRIDKSVTKLELIWNIVTKLSYAGMIGLHLAEATLTVPSQYPDLFPVLWSIGGCLMCFLAWLRTIVYLGFHVQSGANGNSTMKNKKKVE